MVLAALDGVDLDQLVFGSALGGVRGLPSGGSDVVFLLSSRGVAEQSAVGWPLCLKERALVFLTQNISSG